MKLTDKIDNYMRVFGVANLMDLSKATTIPYTTLKNLFVKGCDNVQRGTLIKLKNTMQITLDELADDNIDVDFEAVKNKAYIDGQINVDDNTIISIGRGGKRTIHKLDNADAQIVDSLLDRLSNNNR